MTDSRDTVEVAELMLRRAVRALERIGVPEAETRALVARSAERLREADAQRSTETPESE